MQAALPGGTAHPANIDEALAMLRSSLGHLTGADWRAAGSAVQARALRELGAAQSKLMVARSEALGAFDARDHQAPPAHLEAPHDQTTPPPSRSTPRPGRHGEVGGGIGQAEDVNAAGGRVVGGGQGRAAGDHLRLVQVHVGPVLLQ